LHVPALLLVKRQKIRPSHNGCGPAAIHYGNIFTIKLVQPVDIAYLPCSQIFAQRVVDLLFVRQRHNRIRAVVVHLFRLILFLLLLCVLPSPPRRAQRHHNHQRCKNRRDRPHSSTFDPQNSAAKPCHKPPCIVCFGSMPTVVIPNPLAPSPCGGGFCRVRDLLCLYATLAVYATANAKRQAGSQSSTGTLACAPS